MQTFDAIRTRRAVKHFDPAHRLTAAEEQTLFELALTAPSAFNLQHGRLVKVDDPALRQSIREVAWNQAQVTDASLLLVLTADLASWRKHAGRIWQEAPGPVQDFMTGAIDAYYRDKPLVQRDETMRSGGILAQTLMLAARAMGYDSCPMDGFDFDAVARLVNLPDDHVIVMMVAICKALEPARPRIGKLPVDEVVVRNRF